MPNKSNIWPDKPTVDGVATTVLPRWELIHELVGILAHQPQYVFRGQREANWLLESSLARLLKDHPERQQLVEEHLNTFKLASRGRRGSNPPIIQKEVDWWALGQHHGLATPLLDWTTSPYVALFFALAEESDTEYSVIYALNTKRIQDAVDIDLLWESEPSEDSITFHRPLSDENSRLVAQAGLFSYNPVGTDVESWVLKHFKNQKKKITLLKVLVPRNERVQCLKALNVMNINHSTLFPDLYGAGKYSTELLRRKLGETP